MPLDHLDALCPIFTELKGSKVQQIGSGVLIEFKGLVWLLTAGHVIDEIDNTPLLVPGRDNKISEIEGVLAYIKPQAPRKEDNLDFGYFKLDKQYSEGIKSIFHIIPEREFDLSENDDKKKIFSFAGFPYRKSNRDGKFISSEMYSFGAYQASSNEYKALGYSSKYNIVAKFNRKKTFNPRKNAVQIAPLPHGISGGGVFRWGALGFLPQNRRLAGVGHTYHENGGYFVGTKLQVILGAILQNNPNFSRAWKN